MFSKTEDGRGSRSALRRVRVAAGVEVGGRTWLPGGIVRTATLSIGRAGASSVVQPDLGASAATLVRRASAGANRSTACPPAFRRAGARSTSRSAGGRAGGCHTRSIAGGRGRAGAPGPLAGGGRALLAGALGQPMTQAAQDAGIDLCWPVRSAMSSRGPAVIPSTIPSTRRGRRGRWECWSARAVCRSGTTAARVSRCCTAGARRRVACGSGRGRGGRAVWCLPGLGGRGMKRAQVPWRRDYPWSPAVEAARFQDETEPYPRHWRAFPEPWRPGASIDPETATGLADAFR
jgi:hypothetical protein